MIDVTEYGVLEGTIDGDTVVCAGGERVRLLLIDTPELSQAPFGRLARAALLRLLPPGTAARLDLEQFLERKVYLDLHVREGEPIVVLRRVRCADGEPVALETALLVGSTSPAVMAADLRHDSLHAVLTAAGFALRRGTALVTAGPASKEDARLLGVTRGDPMLVERRIILDPHGRPVEATESRYPADRYAIDVRFDVEESAPPVTPRAVTAR